MSQHRVVLIGCGGMGRGIARMLLQECERQNLNLKLWVYDPIMSAENLCLQEMDQQFSARAIQQLREADSRIDYDDLATQMKMVQTQPSLTPEIISAMRKPFDAVQPHLLINAATYFAHQIYVPLAIKLGCDYIDLGQGIPSMEVLQGHENDILETQSGSRIIHESGLAPGLANILAASLYDFILFQSQTKNIYSLQMRVGGLPQYTAKGGDLHYGPIFSVDGLVYEYEGLAYSLRNKELIVSSTFSHPELWEDSTTSPIPFGVCPFKITNSSITSLLEKRVQTEFLEEQNGAFLIKGLQARPTADGTSRMCFDSRFTRTVTNLEYKTFRFSPHYQTWLSMEKQGILNTLLDRWKKGMNDPNISGYPDMILMRIWGQVTPASTPQTIECVVLHDAVEVGDPSGFTAMQHLTGWPTVLIALALLSFPSGSDSSKRPNLFRSPKQVTNLGRTMEEILQKGGVISPYELVDGNPLLKLLADKQRIPLCSIHYSEELTETFYSQAK